MQNTFKQIPEKSQALALALNYEESSWRDYDSQDDNTAESMKLLGQRAAIEKETGTQAIASAQVQELIQQSSTLIEVAKQEMRRAEKVHEECKQARKEMCARTCVEHREQMEEDLSLSQIETVLWQQLMQVYIKTHKITCLKSEVAGDLHKSWLRRWIA